METIVDPQEMQNTARTFKRQGKSIAVVPTMGYLHEGHLSLIRMATHHAEVVITTLFVNPLQFGPNEDFKQYPRDVERDSALALEAGTDILFCPDPEAVYEKDRSITLHENAITRRFEETHRPGHFDGVLTIVAKLFNYTHPDVAVFGEKDAQQLAVVKRMVRDLSMPIRIISGPIVREADGLAMSSRNVYLNEQQRTEAAWINRALHQAKDVVEQGGTNPRAIEQFVRTLIEENTSGTIDYIACVDPDTFQEKENIESPTQIITTVRFGETRLLDNLRLI